MEATQSPLPQKEEKTAKEAQLILKFSDTITHLLAGKKVHKLEWEDQGYYVFMDKAVLKLHKTDGNLHEWILSEGDLMGEDYIIL